MASKDKNLNDLTNLWYAKLAESGFVDIEKKNGKLKKPSELAEQYNSRILQREEYTNLLLSHLSNPDTVFRNIIDRYILTRHAYGATDLVIEQELRETGTSRHRNTIRYVIRKYEVLWKIRKYTRKQLHLRELKTPKPTAS